MVTTRVATFAQSQLITNTALRTQRNINDLQLQIATGKRSQSFSGISDNASRLVSLKSDLRKAEQFLQNITITEKRLSLMEFALDEIETVARTARTDFIQVLNGSAADDRQLPSLAQAALDQVVQLLNTKDDSRYLFAGGNVDTEPVSLTAPYTAPDLTLGVNAQDFDQTVDLNYYRGDSTTQSSRIDEGFNLSYGVLANESAFEKLVRSLDNVANATFTDPITDDEKQLLKDAITELTEAIDNNGTSNTLGDLHANVGLDSVVMDSIKGKHTGFLKFAQDSIAEIENVNPAEAIATLNFEQIQLEASFTTIARIQTLSLSNFLR